MKVFNMRLIMFRFVEPLKKHVLLLWENVFLFCRVL